MAGQERKGMAVELDGAAQSVGKEGREGWGGTGGRKGGNVGKERGEWGGRIGGNGGKLYCAAVANGRSGDCISSHG